MEINASQTLTPVEQELVALGAALASNCVPCVEHHVPAARAAGLDDRKIRAAIQLADKVRQVPARKVLATATSLLGDGAPATPGPASASPCAQPGPGAAAEQPCCG